MARTRFPGSQRSWISGRCLPVEEGSIYLCRCGRSANKPFCDGMHKKAGLQAEECVRVLGR
jgi:CDGSH-type Zn-finger protein